MHRHIYALFLKLSRSRSLLLSSPSLPLARARTPLPRPLFSRLISLACCSYAEDPLRQNSADSGPPSVHLSSCTSHSPFFAPLSLHLLSLPPPHCPTHTLSRVHVIHWSLRLARAWAVRSPRNSSWPLCSRTQCPEPPQPPFASAPLCFALLLGPRSTPLSSVPLSRPSPRPTPLCCSASPSTSTPLLTPLVRLHATAATLAVKGEAAELRRSRLDSQDGASRIDLARSTQSEMMATPRASRKAGVRPRRA